MKNLKSKLFSTALFSLLFATLLPHQSSAANPFEKAGRWLGKRTGIHSLNPLRRGDVTKHMNKLRNQAETSLANRQSYHSQVQGEIDQQNKYRHQIVELTNNLSRLEASITMEAKSCRSKIPLFNRASCKELEEKITADAALHIAEAEKLLTSPLIDQFRKDDPTNAEAYVKNLRDLIVSLNFVQNRHRNADTNLATENICADKVRRVGLNFNRLKNEYYSYQKNHDLYGRKDAIQKTLALINYLESIQAHCPLAELKSRLLDFYQYARGGYRALDANKELRLICSRLDPKEAALLSEACQMKRPSEEAFYTLHLNLRSRAVAK